MNNREYVDQVIKALEAKGYAGKLPDFMEVLDKRQLKETPEEFADRWITEHSEQS